MHQKFDSNNGTQLVCLNRRYFDSCDVTLAINYFAAGCLNKSLGEKDFKFFLELTRVCKND